VTLAATENPQLSFPKSKPRYTVRMRGRDTGSKLKAVPWPLVCFAGRLDMTLRAAANVERHQNCKGYVSDCDVV